MPFLHEAELALGLQTGTVVQRPPEHWISFLQHKPTSADPPTWKHSLIEELELPEREEPELGKESETLDRLVEEPLVEEPLVRLEEVEHTPIFGVSPIKQPGRHCGSWLPLQRALQSAIEVSALG